MVQWIVGIGDSGTYRQIYLKVMCISILVRKDMDVYEQGRLSNITHRHKLK